MSDKPFTIFVVEDDDWYRKLLHHNLTLNPDYKVEVFDSGESFLKSLKNKPDVVTLDYKLPDKNGEEFYVPFKDISKALDEFHQEIKVA